MMRHSSPLISLEDPVLQGKIIAEMPLSGNEKEKFRFAEL